MKILPVSMEKAKEENGSFFIELYNIYLKTGIIRICNCDVVLPFMGYNYYPVPIERGNIKSSVDDKIDNVDLKVSDVDNSKIAALMEGFDFRGRTIEIIRIQYPDSIEDNSIALPIFKGILDSPSYANGEFTCSVKNSFPENKVPFRTTQYFCNNTFGDTMCKMDKKTRVLGVSIANSTPSEIVVTGTTLTADEYAEGLLTIGYETKQIKSNTQNKIVLYYPIMGDMKDSCTISRNCNKTPEMCDKYNNRKNYGGFIAIPKEFRITT